VSTSAAPFDAVLLIAFGGPRGIADIRPFLQNVLRGRRVPADRVEEVAHHYERFEGESPIAEITARQAQALTHRLRELELDLPVYVGMRNWHPFLSDTLHDMVQAGIRRAVGIVAAAHRSHSSCGQYRQNVWDALDDVRRASGARIELVHAGDWHRHHGFIEAVADRIERARTQLPPSTRQHARVVFTAHSIPLAMAHAQTYVRQLRESASAVAARLQRTDWALAFQSRSGRPEDPWLEPDVNTYLRDERPKGLTSVVLSPIGFVADHIEVLYDLDVQARQTCDELGLAMARASAVNDHPRFIDALADTVRQTWRKYRGGRPLALLPAEPPLVREPPPPVRPARRET
jgi:ferrochelatase